MTTDQAASPGTGSAPTGAPGPASLTVFYDRGCALCRRSRAWLEAQPTWLPLTFVAADADEARALLPDLPWLGTELVVVGDDGSSWIGPAAFVTCLWATVRYRAWSRRLASPALAPLAERFFVAVSANRSTLAAALGDGCPDGTCHHRPPAAGATGRPRPASGW
ncbi:DUF393 domain-containing protein [Aquihabitans sp. G128]|uniref:thiol-disulfide oxidoreductase DCC family protein n=1 Tax=Aquihabitans sp. G128 TaxID=2849779 RepID=UPI001C23D066|nr:DCC1-like thiol-disulfide oxidoreductase family protein [Aquihabitans sp. G128]QXC63014.1 DUF393 domain-containing protein [Aquihabitans sp. G128]